MMIDRIHAEKGGMAVREQEELDKVLNAVILKEVAAIECDFSLSPMDRKRTIDDRMKLYSGFDGISEWLYKHGMKA